MCVLFHTQCVITQSLKVSDLRVIFDQFLNFDDHITAHIFILVNRLLYGMMLGLLLFMHLKNFRLDYCNSILYNVSYEQNGSIKKYFRINARTLTKLPWREQITPTLRNLHGLKIQGYNIDVYI